MRSYEIQVAIVGRLSTALSPIAVSDVPPQNEAAPYVQVGDVTVTPNNTKSANGTDEAFEISTYSVLRGYTETKQMLRDIYDSLHRKSLSLSTGQSVIPQFEFSEVFPEPDGVRGVIRFGIQT
jgi:hypothetical protein